MPVSEQITKMMLRIRLVADTLREWHGEPMTAVLTEPPDVRRAFPPRLISQLVAGPDGEWSRMAFLRWFEQGLLPEGILRQDAAYNILNQFLDIVQRSESDTKRIAGDVLGVNAGPAAYQWLRAVDHLDDHTSAVAKNFGNPQAHLYHSLMVREAARLAGYQRPRDLEPPTTRFDLLSAPMDRLLLLSCVELARVTTWFRFEALGMSETCHRHRIEYAETALGEDRYALLDRGDLHARVIEILHRDSPGSERQILRLIESEVDNPRFRLRAGADKKPQLRDYLVAHSSTTAIPHWHVLLPFRDLVQQTRGEASPTPESVKLELWGQNARLIGQFAKEARVQMLAQSPLALSMVESERRWVPWRDQVLVLRDSAGAAALVVDSERVVYFFNVGEWQEFSAVVGREFRADLQSLALRAAEDSDVVVFDPSSDKTSERVVVRRADGSVREDLLGSSEKLDAIGLATANELLTVSVGAYVIMSPADLAALMQIFISRIQADQTNAAKLLITSHAGYLECSIESALSGRKPEHTNFPYAAVSADPFRHAFSPIEASKVADVCMRIKHAISARLFFASPRPEEEEEEEAAAAAVAGERQERIMPARVDLLYVDLVGADFLCRQFIPATGP